MDRIDELIQIGQTFTFRNNSHTVSHGTYSRASDELLGWTASVEDFIRNNYGEESASFRLFQTFDRSRLTGYEQDDFDEQLKIIIGSLKSCKNIPTKSKNTKDDHLVISLIKNPFFWTVLVVVTGVSFALGLHFGSAKFDKEKSEYYEQTKKQEIEINELKLSSSTKDSTLNILSNRINSLQDSLSKNR